MERTGERASGGFTISELERARTSQGPPSSWSRNSPRRAEAGELFQELQSLPWDKKAKMRGKVVSKRARYNLIFCGRSVEPNYEEGRGRSISFEEVPLTRRVRDSLPSFLGDKARNLLAEGNYYYDAEKCGIG